MGGRVRPPGPWSPARPLQHRGTLLSTAGEEEARSTFQGASGSFMVSWPYVYAAAKSAVTSGALAQSVVDDIGWARCPEVTAGQASAPPLGGIDLGIGNFTQHPAEALAAVRCITSVESGVEYMVQSGNPAARDAAYDAPEVRAVFPMADLIRESMSDAGPRPMILVDGVPAALRRGAVPHHPGRSLVRTGILLPYGIITVVSAFVWRYAFQLDSGFINQWLGFGDHNWFGARWPSLFVITLSEIWRTTPFISLLLLAGLVQVPGELQEAAPSMAPRRGRGCGR